MRKKHWFPDLSSPKYLLNLLNQLKMVAILWRNLLYLVPTQRALVPTKGMEKESLLSGSALVLYSLVPSNVLVPTSNCEKRAFTICRRLNWIFSENTQNGKSKKQLPYSLKKIWLQSERSTSKLTLSWPISGPSSKQESRCKGFGGKLLSWYQRTRQPRNIDPATR